MPQGTMLAKVGQVGADVDGKAVVGDAAADFDADGGDFGVFHPYAGQSGVKAGG